MIGTSSLTDDEFATITISVQAFTKALYLEILAVLDGREAVSDTRTRLGYGFKAHGVDIGDTPTTANSKIYLGDGL